MSDQPVEKYMHVQWCSQPKFFWGDNMFNFRWATVFLFETPLVNVQNDYIC